MSSRSTTGSRRQCLRSGADVPVDGNGRRGSRPAGFPRRQQATDGRHLVRSALMRLSVHVKYR
jgi:hypothetical protein